MRFQFLGRWLQRAGRYCVSRRGQSIFAGMLCGCWLLAAVQRCITTFGASPATLTGIAFAIAFAAELSRRVLSAPDRRIADLRLAALVIVPAVWMAALPWLFAGVNRGLSLVPMTALVSPFNAVCVLSLAALALTGPLVFCLIQFPQTFARRGAGTDQPQSGHFVCGLAGGLFATAMIFGRFAGLHLTSIAASAIGAVWFTYLTIRRLQSGGEAATDGESPVGSPRSTGPGAGEFSFVVAAAAFIGALAGVLGRMSDQLGSGAYLSVARWSALLIGVVVGGWWTRREVTRPDSAKDVANDVVRPRAATACLTAAVVAAAALISFPWLVQLSLTVNAFLADPWMVTGYRSLIAGLPMFVLGWCCVALAGGSHVAGRAAGASAPAHGFVAGWIAMLWLIPAVGNTGVVLACLSVLSGAAALFRWIPARPMPVGWLRRSATVAGVAAVVAAPFLSGRYRPSMSARLLFATNVFVSRQRGTELRLLPYLDEGRTLATAEGRHGTLTVWKLRGVQRQVRINGVPKGLVSTDTRICPQFTGEILQAAVPLVLHERPFRVMLLGLGGGVSLETSLAFPVQNLTCVEDDDALVSLLQGHVWSAANQNPLDDDRVQHIRLDPALAVACRGAQYDVIVSAPDHSAMPHTAAYFTREYYTNVARRLDDEGIFCQRFHQVDYGAMPLQSVAATLQAVFKDVAAVEIASGEFALLATNSARGLSRPGLADRMQAPHVRQTLAQVGWDWSVPLNLAAYGNRGLAKFARTGGGRVNTADNALLAYRLPQELIRWGLKWQELAVSLAPQQSRFLEWGGVNPGDPVVLGRLSEVTGQRKLMTSFPDQPWAYRKEVRRRVTENPRTLIRTVSADGKPSSIHDEDKQRMRYFKALSKVATQRHPTAEDVELVARFERPYDPLLSYFLHYELAELLSRAKDRNPSAELQHRLHFIYYGHPQDRSIRNVCKALHLLADEPTSAATVEERWDHSNALIQVLNLRWQTRGMGAPRSSRIVLNDIDKSLAAIDAAVLTMEELHAEAGVSATDWHNRRTVVKRMLAGPLRAYRTRLLAHYHNQKRIAHEVLEGRKADKQKSENPDDATQDESPASKSETGSGPTVHVED